MAASEAAIANAALSHLGVTGRITTLSSDTTTEGKACRAFYERAVRETLAEAHWQSQTVQVALTLVETFAASETREWYFAYRVPENCVTPIRLLWAGVRNPRPDQAPPFRLYADTDSTAYSAAVTYTVGQYASSGGIWYRALRETIADTPASSALDWVAIENGPPSLLYTDLEDATLEYVAHLDDPTRYEWLLEHAIIARLAWYVGPLVTGANAEARASAGVSWTVLIAQAKAHDYQARVRDLPPVGGWQAARFQNRV